MVRWMSKRSGSGTCARRGPPTRSTGAPPPGDWIRRGSTVRRRLSPPGYDGPATRLAVAGPSWRTVAASARRSLGRAFDVLGGAGGVRPDLLRGAARLFSDGLGRSGGLLADLGDRVLGLGTQMLRGLLRYRLRLVLDLVERRFDLLCDPLLPLGGRHETRGEQAGAKGDHPHRQRVALGDRADGLRGAGQPVLNGLRGLAGLLGRGGGRIGHATAGAVGLTHHLVPHAGEPLSDGGPPAFHHSARAHPVADGLQVFAERLALAFQVVLQLICSRAHCTSSFTVSAVFSGTGRTWLSLSLPLGRSTAAATA